MARVAALVFIVLSLCCSAAVSGASLRLSLADSALSANAERYLVDTRRALHRIPELGFQETQTSSFLRSALTNLSVPHISVGHGLMATVGSNSSDSPAVALRADMDALPIAEQSSLPPELQSSHPGLMHACGHDSHMAMLLGAVRALKQHENSLPGTVKAIFSPAEEGGAGAKEMLDAGVFDLPPKPSASFAMHVWPYAGAPTGTLLSKAGPLMAASGMFEAEVHGTGGHAALPHRSVDPVPAASACINALQTLVSREANPVSGARVVSVSQLNSHGSNAPNVLPSSVTLSGTYRAMSGEDLEFLGKRIRETIELVSVTYGCNATVDVRARERVPYPALINDGNAMQHAQQAATDIFGANNVHETEMQMVAEDYAFFAERIPSAMVLLGVRNESIGATHALHSPKFMLDESALSRGSALHVQIAEQYLRRHSENPQARKDYAHAEL